MSPSRLLAEMRSLLGESGSQDRLLQKLFLDRLPTGVRRIFVSHLVEDLDRLAKIPDRVMEENRKCTSGFGDGPEYNDYASSVGTSNVSLSALHETVTDLAQTVTSHILSSPCHTPEVESRTQGSRPRTQKKSEAKAKESPSEDRTSRGQGPRTQAQVFSKKKSLQNFFSGDLQFIGVWMYDEWLRMDVG